MLGTPGEIAAFGLYRFGVLEVNFCARPRYNELPTPIFTS